MYQLFFAALVYFVFLLGWFLILFWFGLGNVIDEALGSDLLMISQFFGVPLLACIVFMRSRFGRNDETKKD